MSKNKVPFTTKEAIQILTVSLVASVFANLLLKMASGFATSFVAYDFDILSYFDLNGVNFFIEATSPQWYLDSKISVLLAKPVSSMFIGLFAMAGLMIIRKKLISFFFLLFWINLYAFNNSAGILIDDLIAKTGLYDVPALYKLPTEVFIVASILSVYILYRIGIVNTLIFRTSIEDKFEKSSKNRILIFVFAILIPWLANGIIPVLSKDLQAEFLFFLEGASMIILLLPFFLYKPKNEVVTKIGVISKVLPVDWINVTFYILGIIILFLTLNHGIHIFAT